MSMRAMIMAAGLGLRMRPLTERLPKPLVPVSGVALIDRTLNWLESSGVEDVVINTHYLADMLEEHLARRVSPRIHLSRESVLLETGGGVNKALPMLGDAPFFVVNGDAICLDGKEPALRRLLAHWDEQIMDILLLLHPVADALGYEGKGDFFLSADMPARRGEAASAPYVFTGIQLLHPRIFSDVPEGAFSLNLLYDRALQAQPKPRLRALVHDGHWLHVGDVQGLRASEAFLDKQQV